MKKKEIRLCMGSSCYTRGNNEILNSIREYLEKNKLLNEVDFRGHLCQGKCNKGPNLTIDKKEYHEVSRSNIELILQEEFEKTNIHS